ncbi:MAG: glycosyltransferase family 2 protein [Ignavibacterium sp.]|nr:glycosyltransferase family 2 protein [Ignavibacterium sp.]
MDLTKGIAINEKRRSIMTGTRTISIVIINYNLADQVRNCVYSLLRFCNPREYELILFENGSTENSIESLVEELKTNSELNLKFIKSDINLGFGKACNKAVEHSDSEILFFLNPDTLVENDLIAQLNSQIVPEIYQRNVIAGLKVNSNLLFDFSAGYFPNLFFEFLNIFLLGRFFEAFLIKVKTLFTQKPLLTDWVMGSATILRKDLFEKINGFAPEYFLYFEEMDLCKRTKDLGFEVKYFHNIEVNHLGSVGSKKNYYFFTKMFYKGKLIFLKKHNTEIKFKLFTFLIRLHFFSQILLWSALRIKSKRISAEKIKAFKELLKYLNCPEKISNNFID